MVLRKRFPPAGSGATVGVRPSCGREWARTVFVGERWLGVEPRSHGPRLKRSRFAQEWLRTKRAEEPPDIVAATRPRWWWRRSFAPVERRVDLSGVVWPCQDTTTLSLILIA